MILSTMWKQLRKFSTTVADTQQATRLSLTTDILIYTLYNLVKESKQFLPGFTYGGRNQYKSAYMNVV